MTTDSLFDEEKFSTEEQILLLRLARAGMTDAAYARGMNSPDLGNVSARLRALGASFVTLTVAESGMLRGCLGTLEARMPLVQDVYAHGFAAASQDPRFAPVRQEEVDQLRVEVSVLSAPRPLVYDTPQELVARLRPQVDGVVLRDGTRRATFLPQVWEKIPSAEEFLSRLCEKMGIARDTWRRKHLQVAIYSVQEWKEA